MKKKTRSRFKNKKKEYEKRKYLFNCKSCSKGPKQKTEFVIKKFQRFKGAILRCSKCGLLISRKIKYLDSQIKDEKN